MVSGQMDPVYRHAGRLWEGEGGDDGSSVRYKKCSLIYLYVPNYNDDRLQTAFWFVMKCRQLDFLKVCPNLIGCQGSCYEYGHVPNDLP